MMSKMNTYFNIYILFEAQYWMKLEPVILYNHLTSAVLPLGCQCLPNKRFTIQLTIHLENKSGGG